MSTAETMGLIDALNRTDSVDEIHALCAEACTGFGFDHFIYGARTPTSLVHPHLFIISGFPTPWWEHYKEQNYFQIDPTVAHCASRTVPLIWNSLAPREGENPAMRRFMDESRSSGLRSGVSLPVHGWQGESAMLSMVSSREPEAMQQEIVAALPELQLLTAHLHEAVRRLVEVREITAGPQPGLTDRERECLLWSAEGKTSWETSQILGIAERTVIFHLQNAGTKLNVTNRQQAVARAISLRLVTPQFG
ncbi:transcriptional regulator, LuxR family [Desulfuromonas soudanensis]|uniref:Transcriptional regulator, LuxR family n=1 Tax=Desulfuromonas soudanensis TaxID=1603606 RepID=A0A0M4CZV2_9BACT|nr:LuxR family transcriptional regulator [Desulfuromonas soudanensis]ALC15001.1 transcriptional regulator, LuxR family [Desulfuromonas soudanensis]